MIDKISLERVLCLEATGKMSSQKFLCQGSFYSGTCYEVWATWDSIVNVVEGKCREECQSYLLIGDTMQKNKNKRIFIVKQIFKTQYMDFWI